jgi:thiol-disulfide isomerase/thioredoxin
MICIIAMIVFGVLGIFSVGYRQLALQAFDCVFRRMTFRPCQTGFDQMMKSKILAKLMRFPKLARFTHKHFEAISWLFTISLFLSMGYTAYGVYNLFTYGSCDPQHPENCVFTPFLNTTINNSNSNICVITGDFVEFYGEECPHCKAMVPIVAQVEAETGIIFQKIEIWHNDTNKQTYMMHASDIERDCGLLGVPAFYASKTGKALCGELSAEKLKDFIRQNG